MILTGKSSYIIMFVIQGDPHGQKVKFPIILFSTNTNVIVVIN